MRREIWFFIFALGAVLFNWPILSIFGDKIIYYFFITWLVFIGIVFITSKASEREDGGG